MPTCDYCTKTFSKQSTLDVHMCEPKRRWSLKDNKVHVLAFEIFRRFYEINYSNQRPKQFVDFVNSQYYRAFVKQQNLSQLIHQLKSEHSLIGCVHPR